MSGVLKFIRNNKRIVKIIIILLILFLLVLVIFKSLFYSNSQKSVYGVRLRDYEKNKIDAKTKKVLQEKCVKAEEISSCKIEIKGRLVKYFINFNDNTSNEVIKNKINELIPNINDVSKVYYDIEFYAIEKREDKVVYPVIGYKHKSKEAVSFDEF